MDKVYNHKDIEEKIYKNWETGGYFKPEINSDGKPFCIILPPPNANGALHFGHAMFTVEDILIRYHRMLGDKTLWLPGTDHAGIETQFVFEKRLKKEGRSRLDFDQETLYKMIHEYVDENRGGIENQLRRLGFSLDWTREKYTLDPEIVSLVYKTFKKMYDDNLVYRDYRLVNYCTFDGTSFSDLEVVYEEKHTPLYYIKYGPLVLATTRPETKFGDTAVAVNPKDKRYKKYVGKEIDIETVLGKAKIKVVADDFVDPDFGTGVVKITPAHDFDDYQVAKRHDLPLVQVIDYNGKMMKKAGRFEGMYAKAARKEIVLEMQKKGLIEKIDEKYVNRTPTCYKCKNTLEPLPLEQWFVKVDSLKESAMNVVKTGKIKITPKNFENAYLKWLENLKDWNISRQIVWGIRIPAWKCLDCGEWSVTEGEVREKCGKCSGNNIVQDKDTFDTWFSSGQWPYLTLKTSKPGDFETFYPTSVMETAYDILKAWVSRMVMFGIYLTKEVPFRSVLFHGLVNDPYGKKMSKSKGNVINPLELVDSYGADAVRFALVYGNATGNDQSLSYAKLEAARKFTNKLWNMARFIEMTGTGMGEKTGNYPLEIKDLKNTKIAKNDEEMIKKVEDLIKSTTKLFEKYDFNHASQNLYEFLWHQFADVYIEDVKNRINKNSYEALRTLFLVQLKLLHPIMPFVTEEINKRLFDDKKPLIIARWP